MRIDDFNGVLIDRFTILDYLDELGLIRGGVGLKVLSRVVDAIKSVLPEDSRVVSISLVGDFIICGDEVSQELYLENTIDYKKALAEIGCRYIKHIPITAEQNMAKNRELVDCLLEMSVVDKESFISYLNNDSRCM